MAPGAAGISGCAAARQRFGWFWAEIPGHVKERTIRGREWIWEAGRGGTHASAGPVQEGLPIRIFIFTPFIALLLVMVGATAIVALRTADDDARMLATRLHQVMSANIRGQLDDPFAASPQPAGAEGQSVASLLRSHTAGPTAGPSSLTRAEKSLPRRFPQATRWWRARSLPWRGTPVHRDCLPTRPNSSLITSRPSRSRGKPG